MRELFLCTHNGVKTNTDALVIDIDRERLVERMRLYCNPAVSFDDLCLSVPRARESRGDYDAREGREANARIGFQEDCLRKILYRPFDYRWVYDEPRTGLVNSPRVDFVADLVGNQTFLECRQRIPTPQFDRGIVCCTLGETMGNGTSTYIPILHYERTLYGSGVQPNVEPAVLEALCAASGIQSHRDAGQVAPCEAEGVAASLFHHVVAVLWSPAYRRENEAALRQDWPRVPIPAERGLLAESARLGREVADLLLPDRPVRGVTCSTIRPELRPLGIPSKVGGGNIDPDADLKVEVTWGFFGAKNAVMCGKGKTLPSAADPQGAVDVYINDRVYWANVPLGVWTMTIGGYPVIKKWLSYREFRVLGRPLLQEELTYITEVVRRLKALLLMGGALDANYRSAAENAMAFDRRP